MARQDHRGGWVLQPRMDVEHLPAVDGVHLQVEQHRIEGAVAHQLHGVGTVVGHLDGEAERPQRTRETASEDTVVVDQKDARRGRCEAIFRPSFGHRTATGTGECHRMPYFLSLSRTVLRGSPTRRAASLTLLPLALKACKIAAFSSSGSDPRKLIACRVPDLESRVELRWVSTVCTMLSPNSGDSQRAALCCRTAFSSCTLPGHEYLCSSARALLVMRLGLAGCRVANWARNCVASGPMSSRRSRKGGTMIT